MTRQEIRPASVEDVPAIREILAAHGNDGPVTTVDIVGPYVRHLLAHHRVLVATEGELVLGFGAVVDAGVAIHLADLFIRPDRLGQGIGRPLLDALFGDAPRRTTFASADPRALPVYVRAGMLPRWVALYLEGEVDRLPGPPSSFTVKAAEAPRLAALEQDWIGIDRSADHAYWAAQPEADSFVVLEAGEPVAIAHARRRQVGTARAVDHALVRPGADPVPALLAVVRRAGERAPVLVLSPGPNPLLPILLGAGLRIVDRDQYMASHADLVDPARLLPNGGLL
jgi:GNAT superfamily N-acetyltransferase